MAEPEETPLRSCEACGRAVSLAEGVCPHCGTAFEPAPPRQPAPALTPAPPVANLPWSARHHAQVFAAVLTFCFGLLIVRLGLAWLGPGKYAFPGSFWSDPLVVLEALAAGSTLVYVFLRIDEGDFRALFCVALLLFAGEEALTYLSQTHGVLNFRHLATLMAFAAGIYASLALTAAAYDGLETAQEAGHRLAFIACAAVLVLACLRAFSAVLRGAYEQYFDSGGLVVLIAVGVYLVFGLLRSYWRNGK